MTMVHQRRFEHPTHGSFFIVFSEPLFPMAIAVFVYFSMPKSRGSYCAKKVLNGKMFFAF